VQHFKEVGASGVGCPQLSQAHTETRAAEPAKAEKAERREEARGEKSAQSELSARKQGLFTASTSGILALSVLLSNSWIPSL